MPCGGIVPIAGGPGTVNDKLSPGAGGCWVCHRGGCKHMAIEWDTYIHAVCAATFLLTSEGSIILQHKHEVLLNPSLEEDLPESCELCHQVMGKVRGLDDLFCINSHCENYEEKADPISRFYKSSRRQ